MKAIETVLLVDDEPDIRKIGEMSLSRIGRWRVVLATTGSEALEAAERERPDVILLDVMLPGMDGPTCMTHLRAAEATRAIPVIFMTAKVQRPEVDRYVALGAAGVIAKPFDPMTLPSEVRRLVDGS